MAGLRLVALSSADVGAAELLCTPDGATVTDRRTIEAIFALYFQWSSHARAYLRLEDRYLECSLDYDRDLAVPLEIQVTAACSQPVAAPKTIRILVEVFRTCFVLEATVLADLSTAGTNLSYIFPLPGELLVQKARVHPRYLVPEDHPLRKCSWRGSDGSVTQTEILDLSVNSMRLAARFPDKTAGVLLWAGFEFPSQISRLTEDGASISLQHPDLHSFNRFFERFTQVAYPRLRRTCSLPPESLYALYLETGYLSSFGTEAENAGGSTDDERRKKALTEFWKAAPESLGPECVDFVSVAADGALAGASGLAKIFEIDGKGIWAMHQLCAKKLPVELPGTRDLYCWRIEYLAGLTSGVEAVVWYKSGKYPPAKPGALGS